MLLAAFSIGAVALAGCGAGNFFGNVATPVAESKGPQLGYLWMQKDSTLRPILGVAGASQLGQSVVPAGAYLSAASANAGSFALMQRVDGTVDVVMLPGATVTPLALSIPVGALLCLSPSGATGLVYTPGASAASVITGLPGTPKIRVVSANAAIVDAAVSDTGSVAFEVAQSAGLLANVIGTDGKPHLVASLRAAGGMAFVPGRDTLLLADQAANTLTSIAAASSAPAASTISTAGLLQGPTVLGVSASGHWAMVANGTGNSVVSVDLVHNTSTAVVCSCSPTTATPLADDGVFRITAAPSGPNWVVDGSRAAPQVLFIPPLAQLLPRLHLDSRKARTGAAV